MKRKKIKIGLKKGMKKLKKGFKILKPKVKKAYIKSKPYIKKTKKYLGTVSRNVDRYWDINQQQIRQFGSGRKDII